MLFRCADSRITPATAYGGNKARGTVKSAVERDLARDQCINAANGEQEVNEKQVLDVNTSVQWQEHLECDALEPLSVEDSEEVAQTVDSERNFTLAIRLQRQKRRQ